MKKFLLIALIVMFMFFCRLAAPAQALTWTTANQITVAWDQDPSNVAGQGERFRYRLFLSNSVTDPGKTNPQEIGITDQLQYTFTLGVKGRFIVGIETVLEVTDDGGATWGEVNVSDRCWSDDTGPCTGGNAFGVRFYPKPAIIQNLRAQ